MGRRARQPSLSPARRLARLKTVVKQLNDLWPDVLQRQLCLQALGGSAELHEALRQTYAAHVTNMLQNVLVIDLIRELGALVCDPNKGAASVTGALKALQDTAVLTELQAEYRVVPPLPRVDDAGLSSEDSAAINEAWRAQELEINLERFAALRGEIDEIRTALAESKAGPLLWDARSKSAAHYEVVDDRGEWKMWNIEETGLTWGQINEFVELCTKAIDTLSLFVLHTSFSYQDSKEISGKNVDEFITALAAGLQSQKRDRERRRGRGA
jgi:hypothetical protein